ncbi:MAG: tRNA uridine(34) 5-carboxymethylaminomethyl modification radical SAM/GNAT enzyme Elp3 [Candidatus Nezhaarchaeota archaeon]|nr:tRNA uridine(34) 5-carboxymethylaminomethyl modification radical SAM/GNAT enzyme Elp3 [Candidatus Nezhaarchaeota archaeon]MCX8141235.1 tRNA uridine(34) 5-carboxymethylaminomethyl modification radical SAM/GNAT enzyme Elp3 [Candidatus Nezhaarchaeota archaeon]MDW8049501.1 tRNA uridine(34) 5-carboxymethylaminomethyl modification radical SAM/GNAT enzyme Elp3 [Nitrososphaerota archaeon]
MKAQSELMAFREACLEIAKRILESPPQSIVELNRIKIEVAKTYRIKPPKNSDILRACNYDEKLKPILKAKKVRSISGIIPVAVMVKPHPCPHGRCIYCPGGLEVGTPASYTGQEPAGRRAKEHNYDPYLQVKSRINQLREIGHCVDKVEIIILGGNFTYLPHDYQKWFVKRCLDAVNDFEARDLEEAKLMAERAKIRISCLSAETRPDWFKREHANSMLEMGFTRVELGVQTVFDDIYELINRGHTVNDVVEAFKVAKDCGFEVIAHFMLGLPGSDPKRDLEMFKVVFNDPRFKPDCIKIYPTLVLKGTKLYEMWLKGEYKPYSSEEAAEIIAEIKKMIPRWIRIQRVQRDIPAHLIIDGVKRSDLRLLALKKLESLGLRCNCIRCREAGHVKIKKGVEPRIENIKLRVERYEASDGVEVFLSFEDTLNDILVGLLRLRIPSSNAFRPEVRERPSAVVRVLHVYGDVVPVGERISGAWQHKGYGSMLLKEAERIAVEEYDVEKVLVLSAIGVKEYYARHGYRRDGVYMAKTIK